jgi:hypothetical protein
MRGDTAWNWMIVALAGKPTESYVDKVVNNLATQLGGVSNVTRVKAKA